MAIPRPLRRSRSFQRVRAVDIANHQEVIVSTTLVRLVPTPLAHPEPRVARDHGNKANSISTIGLTVQNLALSTHKVAQRASHIQHNTQAFTLLFQSKACHHFRRPCILIPPVKVGLPSCRSMLIKRKRSAKAYQRTKQSTIESTRH